MDVSGDTRKVRYTTLFTIGGGFYIFQADPAEDETFKIALCAKLTAQQFANFVASFAGDAGERFGHQDAQMDRAVAQGGVGPAPISDVDFYANSGEQRMPAVLPSNYAKTGTSVGGQIGFASDYSRRIPAPSPARPASFSHGVQQVPSGAAAAIYIA